MKPEPDPAAKATTLRQQAEARLREQGSADRRSSEADNRRLLHELQVHQVELELQKHALLELREQLERSLEQYTDLYDFAPVGYFTLAHDSAIRTANLAGAALLGVERAHLIERQFGIFVAAADRPMFNAFLDRVLVGAARERCEIAFAREGAPLRHVCLQGVAVHSGVEWVCQVAAMDITERKLAEEVLTRRQLIEIESVYATAPVGLAVLDTELRFLRINQRLAEMNGYPAAAHLGRTVREIVPQVADDVEPLLRGIITSGEPLLNLEITGETAAQPGIQRSWRENFYPLKSPDGQIIGINVVTEDITERKRVEQEIQTLNASLERRVVERTAELEAEIAERKEAERQLFEANERLKALMEALPVGVSLSDDATCQRITGNSTLLAQFEMAPQDNLSASALDATVLGRRVRYFLDGRELGDVELPLQRAVAENRVIPPMELEIQMPSGRRWIADAISAPLRNAKGQIIGGLAVTMDITGRKRVEEGLRAALAEKEVLLREVHHWVKNNLAAIIGLLELQQEGIAEQPPTCLLLSCQLAELGNRIRSMALVHEMLYQSENLNRIDFQEYLQTLVTHLRYAFDPSGAIRIAVAATDVYLDLDAAIPCGLIVNELVINAFKYAFPGQRPRPGASTCEITVTAAWDSVACTLTVADNGVGLLPGLDWATTRTLGLRLVRMLGQHQLGGQLELDRGQGTRFSLRFGSRQNPGSRPA